MAPAPPLLIPVAMIRRQFFRPDVELVVKLVLGVFLASTFLVTLAWGYEQRRQAQEWREAACAYRVADLARRAPFLARDSEPRSACGRLDALGVSLETY